MTEYVHLIGAEEVTRAASRMSEAASTMSSAASQIDTAISGLRDMAWQLDATLRELTAAILAAEKAFAQEPKP